MDRAGEKAVAILKMVTAMRQTVTDAAKQLEVKQSEFHVTRKIVQSLNVTMQQPSIIFHLDIGVLLLWLTGQWWAPAWRNRTYMCAYGDRFSSLKTCVKCGG